jgi:ATP-dependent exoDNAse (exonuclease V) beta subunit
MLYFINPEKSVHECLGGLSKDPEFFIGSLPGEFVRNQEKYKKLSLYEMVENIISVFSLDKTKKDLIYLLGFQNIVQQYVSENTSDLHSFIEWCNKKGISKTLSVSQDVDAMRIITVHKAKGLEFKVVIMPFCDWNLDHDSHITNILWCKTDEQPFNELPLLPVKYSKDLSKTIFLNDYISEKLDAYIDNLNLLYVAFTRAMDQLITISPEVPIKGEIKSTGGLLKFLIDKPEINTHSENLKLSEFYMPEKNLLEISSDFCPKDKHKETTGIKLLNYYTNTSNKPLKIRRQSSEFFNLSDQQKNRISKGRILHSVFENIIIEQDIETAVRRAENEGIVSFSEIDEIKQIISDSFKNPMVKNWFSEENKVLNEVSILLPENVQKRPDRVILKDNEVHVIDYKFGEQNPSYNDQVKEYCEILNQMGYIKVRGYIWYVMDNLIVEI